MERQDGILQMTFHAELPAAFHDVGNDVDNRCVILAGTGDAFSPGIDLDVPRLGRRGSERWHQV